MPELKPFGKRVFRRLIASLYRARLGFPQHVYAGAGGIGDDLMCSTVFHELRRRRGRGIVFATQNLGLFQENPDLDAVILHQNTRLNRWIREGLEFTRLGYGHYHPETDKDDVPADHVLAALCRLAGISGPIDLRPYLYLTLQERTAGRLAENQIVIQSSGLSAAFLMQNKEWGTERFQQVCNALREKHTVLQIGSNQDPKLDGAVDLRGKTSLRQSAAILANASVFVGLVGFLMHLSRAVDCRGVIVYGGRETPSSTGYVANINLTGNTPCSPCWLRNRCDFHHECMRIIPPETVIQAAQEQIAKRPQPLEVESVVL
jgi:ADP-heptose:LPS heptosyltransferase